MNLQDLGAIGEFLGFIAVLGTLAYLSAQIRESRIAAGIAEVRALTADFREILGEVSHDPELANILRKGVTDWNSLSSLEQLRAHGVFANVLYMYLGSLPMEHFPDGKAAVAMHEGNTLGLITSPGGAVWWSTMRPLFGNNPQFQRLDSRLADPTTLPPPWSATMPWWRYSDDA